jgi:DNA-binding MarR family transcriptional regulator
MSQAPQAPEIADLLHSAAIHLLRRLRLLDAASGLSAPRASALSVLVFGGPATLSELAEAEQVRLPTISRLVVELEAQGLVEKVVDFTDRRVKRLRATDKGRALLIAARRRRVEALSLDLEALPPDDLILLARAADLLSQLSLPADHPRRRN